MIIRPHHILCILSYQGIGYNYTFEINMNKITQLLYVQKNTIISLSSGIDIICKYCPNNLGNNQCLYEKTVNLLDTKVLQTFKL